MASAHWDTQTAAIYTTGKLDTINGFGGFPKQLYEIKYPANGVPEMAAIASDLLMQAGINAKLDARRDLDHDSWVPLMLMCPQANITAAQISI